jgi:hypothetical protein
VKRGDEVLIEYRGQTIRGEVALVSWNQRSVMLKFDGMLLEASGGAFIGYMAAMRDEAGTYRDLKGEDVVTIEPVRSEG